MILIAGLALNVLVLSWVVGGLLRGTPVMGQAYGPDLPARRILTCLYGAIWLASICLAVLLVIGVPWAVPACLTLFALQSAYKLGTVAYVGLDNPVVVANFVITLALVAVTGLYVLS